MKKMMMLLVCLSLFVGSLCLTPMEAAADAQYKEGAYTYTVSNGAATIVAVDKGISGAVVVPDTLGGYPVKAIGSGAFADCIALTEIEISSVVESIGSGAFAGCNSLEAMTLPFVGGSKKTATDTYQYPFGYIFGTASTTDPTPTPGETTPPTDEGIDLPYIPVQPLRMAAVYSRAATVATKQYFYGFSTTSTSSETYYIPSSLRFVTVTGGEILYGAFNNCVMLTDITVAGQVAAIGASAFKGCAGLEKVTISESVTSVGKDVFSGCSELQTVHYEGTQEQKNQITIDASNTQFVNAQWVYDVVVEAKKILTFTLNEDGESYSLTGCDFETAGVVEIPATYEGKPVTVIDGAFYDRKKVTGIIIPEGIESISNLSFCGSKITTITIPDSVTSIGYGIFNNCSNLVSVTIGSGVESLGRELFVGCTELADICVSKDNPFYCSDEKGVMFNKEKTVLLYTPVKLTGEYTVPYGVTHIDSTAFNHCTGLEKILIPDSISTIGAGAFFYCDNLQYNTYNGGKYLGNVRNPYVVLCQTEQKDMETFSIHPNAKVIHYKALLGCTALTEIVIPEGIVSIGDAAFSNCTALEKVNIPEGVTYIGENAFASNTALTEITIPESVTVIGDNAFRECTQVTKLTISNGVTDIGVGAFSNCTGLTEVTIPGSVKKIGHYAFYFCKGLKTVVIQEGVTDVGRYAFAHCRNLNGIFLPQSVATIQNSAFFDKDSGIKREVFYPGTQAQKEQMTIEAYNDGIAIAQWHYEVEDMAFAGQDCYYCPECDTCFLPDGEKALATVTFLNWDGTVLFQGPFSFNQEVTLPATPTKPADNTYTYTFKGWDREVVNCLGNATYEAVFEREYIDYTVTFRYEDGTVIATDTYHYGETVIAPETPEIPDTLEKNYIFVGWDKDVVPCAGSTVYTAVFATEYIDYTVTFRYEDGTELSKNTYHYGQAVTVPAAPTKASDNTYTYTFKGWDKEVVNCQGNATYTAVFERTFINYTVTFQYEDGTVIQEKTYHYGAKVIAPANPAAPEGFAFAGWDEDVTDCLGNATYTAVFKAYIPGDVDGVESVTDADAVYLLYHTFLPEQYPVNQPCDFDGDGQVTDADAVYLLYYTFLPDEYPLH